MSRCRWLLVTAKKKLECHGVGVTLIMDVPASDVVAETGITAGAQEVSRGFIEFAAGEAIRLTCGCSKKEAKTIHALSACSPAISLAPASLREPSPLR